MKILVLTVPLACANLLGFTRVSACDLQVDAGWIREAPPGATSLAAYATLKNTSRHPLQIDGVNAQGAEQAMLHETTVEGDIVRMRMMSSLAIAAGAKVVLAPGASI